MIIALHYFAQFALVARFSPARTCRRAKNQHKKSINVHIFGCIIGGRGAPVDRFPIASRRKLAKTADDKHQKMSGECASRRSKTVRGWSENGGEPDAYAQIDE